LLIVTTKHGDQDSQSPTRPGDYLISTLWAVLNDMCSISPRYDNPSINLSVPDFRTTIYWNPIAEKGKDGHISFEFFNADSKDIKRGGGGH
jgi:hypothetical protein